MDLKFCSASWRERRLERECAILFLYNPVTMKNGITWKIRGHIMKDGQSACGREFISMSVGSRSKLRHKKGIRNYSN